MGIWGPDRRNRIKSKYENTVFAWPENYYREFDPAARKKMLDERDNGSDAMIGQMRKLFDIRYTKDKKGKYIDNFLFYFIQLKVVSESLDKFFSKKRNIKEAKGALKSLCLLDAPDFTDEMMYSEMCQLVSYYIETSSGDVNYTAVAFGLGKQNDDKIKNKIQTEINRIGVLTPKHLEMEDEYYVLKQAVLDTMEEYFENNEQA